MTDSIGTHSLNGAQKYRLRRAVAVLDILERRINDPGIAKAKYWIELVLAEAADCEGTTSLGDPRKSSASTRK